MEVKKSEPLDTAKTLQIQLNLLQLQVVKVEFIVNIIQDIHSSLIDIANQPAIAIN